MLAALSGEYGGERVLCGENPTGTGKSLGYLLPAIPVAQAREKTLVIATATVALQEQLIGKDLPDLQARAGLDFSFALAKGRRHRTGQCAVGRRGSMQWKLLRKPSLRSAVASRGGAEHEDQP